MNVIQASFRKMNAVDVLDTSGILPHCAAAAAAAAKGALRDRHQPLERMLRPLTLEHQLETTLFQLRPLWLCPAVSALEERDLKSSAPGTAAARPDTRHKHEPATQIRIQSPALSPCPPPTATAEGVDTAYTEAQGRPQGVSMCIPAALLAEECADGAV